MTALPQGLHGAHLRTELTAALGPRRVRDALREGTLNRWSRAVLVEPRRATDFLTRAAALLTVGPTAVLAGHSALAVHGCAAADSAPIHLRVPYERKVYRHGGVVTHQGQISDDDVVKVAGLRVLVLDVALAEVLCRGTRRAAMACADEVLGLFDDETLREDFRHSVRDRIGQRADPRGRRQALSLLHLASGLAESPAESWTLLELVTGGFPIPEQQFRVLDSRGVVLYRLDFAWPQARIAVEYDGYQWHEARREADAARDEDLRRRGWTVIRARAEDLAAPGRLLAEVEDAFRRRGLSTARGESPTVRGDSRAVRGNSPTARGNSRAVRGNSRAGRGGSRGCQGPIRLQGRVRRSST
ncbi:endonuclease domain-containing protein [Saccharomonospora saliphila]|uniref:endonuclease domain-containing protein n=1 Tax=Saccharomonospora saliphila TaxID=369829 RepID=UPI00037A5CAA|nr:DUF559 domain-containing protein [Saccharomonospora saliphila]